MFFFIYSKNDCSYKIWAPILDWNTACFMEVKSETDNECNEEHKEKSGSS